MVGELPVCEQVCKIGEWKYVGTSERGRGRVSVDMGMWVKKGEGEERQASMCGCAHECERREGVLVGEGAGAFSPCCKLRLEGQRWG